MVPANPLSTVISLVGVDDGLEDFSPSLAWLRAFTGEVFFLAALASLLFKISASF